jgi:reverse gyrase
LFKSAPNVFPVETNSLFRLNFVAIHFFCFLLYFSTASDLFSSLGKMGAYKYMQEIWRKKQSDVMRYLQRIRTWQYRQLGRIHRCPRPTRPEKARRLGYKAKQGSLNLLCK